MKLVPIFVALLLPGAASAQTAPRDPAIAAYQQLLLEANDRVATMGGRIVTLEKQLAGAAAELEKKKAPHAPLPNPADNPDQKDAPASAPGN